MAFGAFSRHEVLSMVRSAALLSPIAFMGQMPSPLARAAADIFLAEVITLLHISLATSLPPRFSCGMRFFRVFLTACC